eukprot:NODE_956_length_2911_cov_0.422475.p1 type:complete len:283 gc:universal NODE_956_length_2911_cov_0.422475:2484-1636(-)
MFLIIHLFFSKIVHDNQITTKSESLAESDSNEDEKLLHNLCHEIKILTHLNENGLHHTNIIQMKEAKSDCNSDTPTYAQYTMKRFEMDAFYFFKTIESRDANQYNIISFMNQMLSALNYLHTLNPQIAHGDFKFQNIFGENVDGKIHWVLGDFGFAKLGLDKEKHIMVSDLRGTKPLMAPEIWKKRIDSAETNTIFDAIKADIFALGILLAILHGIQQYIPERIKFSQCFELSDANHVIFEMINSSTDPKANLKDIAKLMAQCDPVKQPSAYKLLQLNIFKT